MKVSIRKDRGLRITKVQALLRGLDAEKQLGRAAGDVHIYGGGAIGRIVAVGGTFLGALHPEFGHLKVPRFSGDDFAGVCPFHSDCLEGLASGPAMAARWAAEASTLPSGHKAWEMQAWYLAQGVLALAAILAPSRVVIGGGVSQAENFHARVGSTFRKLSAGYFSYGESADFIVPPSLGQQAGILGALLLAASG